MQIEFLQNGLGFYNQSFLPYMSNDFVQQISRAIDNYFVEKVIENQDYNEQRIKIDVQQTVNWFNLFINGVNQKLLFVVKGPVQLQFINII